MLVMHLTVSEGEFLPLQSGNMLQSSQKSCILVLTLSPSNEVLMAMCTYTHSLATLLELRLVNAGELFRNQGWPVPLQK